MRRYALIGLCALLFASTADAQGSRERRAVLDAIRSGTGSPGPFIVDHLRVRTGSGGARIAYAELHSADGATEHPFHGSAFVVRERGGWRLLWALGGGGATDCATLDAMYGRALRLAGASRAALFSREFLADASRARSGTQAGRICIGDVVVPLEDEPRDAIPARS